MLGFYNYCTKFQTIRLSLSQGCIQQGFSSGVLGEQPSVSLLFFRGGWVGDHSNELASERLQRPRRKLPKGSRDMPPGKV
jgi:hypothetical protein